MATVPKNNLPPDSQAFARDLQERLAKLETTVGNLDTLVKGSNARVGSLVNSVNTVNDTVAGLLNQTRTVSNTATALTSGYEPFDPDFDLETAITTAASGSLVVSYSSLAEVVGVIDTSVGYNGDIEVRTPGGTVLITRTVVVADFPTETGPITVTQSATTQFNLDPYTSYVLRTRRGAWGGPMNVSNQSMTVSIVGV